MHFEFLIAVISSGLYAPLGLMAFGFVLAVGGGIFLFLRRKSKSDPAKAAHDETETQLEPSSDSPLQTPSPSDGARRRPLVAGAEREDGTPSGEIRPEQEESSPEEAEIEEADFEEYDEQSSEKDEPNLEPEWIEEEVAQSAEAAPEAEVEVEDLAAAGAVATTEALAEAPSDAPTDTAPTDTAPTDTAPTETAPLEDDAAPAASLPPLSAESVAALRKPIVFRQFLPQSPGKDGLSFYGGRPIGPPDFQWPRERGAQGGAPLQFVMQWDCRQLAEQDPTGLLPQEGVLYCFLNFDRDLDEDFLTGHTFIHHRGSPQGWGEIEMPEDAGLPLGKRSAKFLSGCTDQVENADQFVPEALPRFPFAPIAFDYPVAEGKDPVFWSGEAVANALLGIQKSGVSVRQAESDPDSTYRDMERPFPAFPHDFGAIRVIASRLIEALADPDEFLAETLYPSLSVEEREAQFAQWSEEAKELFLLGTQRPSSQKLDQNIADDIWQWFEARKGILDTKLPALVTESVDLSLSANSDALSNIPGSWIDKAMRMHALAAEYVDGDSEEAKIRICAGTPARMFGPATSSDGALDGSLHDHLLLLELPSGAGPQHHFEGRVLQYWITPDDLAAGQFGAVKSLVVEPQEASTS